MEKLKSLSKMDLFVLLICILTVVFIIMDNTKYTTDHVVEKSRAPTPAPVPAPVSREDIQRIVLANAKMAWLEARAAQTEAAVKYGADRYSNPGYEIIQNRAMAAMAKLNLERAKAKQMK